MAYLYSIDFESTPFWYILRDINPLIKLNVHKSVICLSTSLAARSFISKADNEFIILVVQTYLKIDG